MRITEANSTCQRSRRSWWIRYPVEQAGSMGKRRAVPGDDRPPLDPIFGSGSRTAALKCAILDCILARVMRALVAIASTIALYAASADTPHQRARSVKR